jgi:hypothetical protein
LPLLTGTVSISGTAVVGQTLTADITALNGTGAVQYQWKRNGAIISGATGGAYTLTTADLGTSIRVMVSRTGYGGIVSSTPVGPVTPSLWDGSIAGGFDGGDGSQADPYRISTGAQLAYLAQQVNSGTSYAGKYFTLTGDLDLNHHEWTAIGTDDKPFKGTFDGAGHVIRNLKINKPTTVSIQGLFGVLDHAEVRDLGLVDVVITGNGVVGGIAGLVHNSSSITASYSTGTVTGTAANNGVGGIAGYVSSSSITASYSTGTITGTYTVGGIAGGVGSNSSITASYSTGTVTGTADVGGIAGGVNSGISITNCAALNPWVKATTSNAGRVVGDISGTGNTFSGNVAWGGMGTNSGVAFNGNANNAGTSVTTTQIQTWTGLPGVFKSGHWTYMAGKLPVLADLAGQNNTLPDHLQ